MHHGLVNAILLPVVVRRNIEHATPKFAKIANAMGIETRGVAIEEAALEVPRRIEGLIEALELPTCLSQVGVVAHDICDLAQQAEQDLCMLTNPHCYPAEEIESMYREAF